VMKMSLQKTAANTLSLNHRSKTNSAAKLTSQTPNLDLC
jgi:hypothetical protein